MNRIDLRGRVAVVTGGAGSIGRAIARRFLLSGAHVVLWDRDGDGVRRAADDLSADGRVDAIAVDLSVPDEVARACHDTLVTSKRVDILIANAGGAGPTVPLWETPPDAWRSVVATNLDTVYLTCRAVVPHMLEQGYGRIVAVASIAGKEGTPLAAAYSAAKAGVIAMCKSLAKELAPKDVVVSCITPSVTDTARLRAFDPERASFVRERLLTRVPMGRLLDPDEIAAMVAWLASSENSFATGAVFDLSGGRATY